MMYLYAVDPGVITNSERLRFLESSIGAGHGRFLADLPNRKWHKLVYAALEDCEDADRKLRIEHLNEIKNYLVNPCFPSPMNLEGTDWTSEAIRMFGCPKDETIRAIISEKKQPLSEKSLSWRELNGRCLLWKADRHNPELPRTTEAIISSLNLLLFQSREIHVVDPYLQFSEQAVKATVQEILCCAIQGKQPSRVCFHTSCKGGTWEHQARDLKKLIPAKLIDPELVQLALWKFAPDAADNRLHDRVVCSELGGVEFGWGLSESPGKTMTANLIDSYGSNQWINNLDWDQDPSFELDRCDWVAGRNSP